MNFIPRIKSKSDVLLHETSAIAEEFRSFYQHLYHVHQHISDQETRTKLIHEYLLQTKLPKLPNEALSAIEGEFTSAELCVALKSMANGKAPGPDGLTVTYYRAFTEILIPRLVNYANAISAGDHFRPETLHAHITIIPKPGKDPSICGSYRPISLLNLDAKLYAKAIANRLLPLLPKWVTADQTGFIPGREARDNSLRTLSLIAYVRGSSQPTLLLSSDAEKAFDRVGWEYLMATLSHIGIGPMTLQQISALYNFPTAQLRINGMLSDPFTLYNGTCQGCPLSPILFALSLEPFLSTIRHNANIHGISVGNKEHKYAAYADDVLFYIQQPEITLPNLMAAFSKFNQISNFKTNMTKSEILNIPLSKERASRLKDSFPL